MKMRFHSVMQSRQQGSVLILALIFMLLLTIIGAGAMQSATLQERMAGGSRDTNTAFQFAEAGLRSAETYLNGSIEAFNGTNGRYQLCEAGVSSPSCSAPSWRDRGSTGWKTRQTAISDLVYAKPEYIIESIKVADPLGQLDSDNSGNTYTFYYRVTARGFGNTSDSMVVLQSVYRKKGS